MEYRITKECGVGWDEARDPAAVAWGVSDAQCRLAKNVAPGDIFLHYIDYAHAWAGYSTVSGALRENDRDSHADWREALPFVIHITRGVWLKKCQCEGTVLIPGLSNKHFNRQVAFTSIHQSDATLIIEAIKKAADAVQATPSDEFRARWETGAENYYREIVIALARGKCRLCKADAASWASRVPISASKEELESIRDSFLDAAHIIARRDSGPMTPDNLRALCPNCHRVVDRLSKERRAKLLGEI